MNIFTKSGLLFIVQVDHLSGEFLGQTIDYFYEAGASNVQIVSSITKKNRPAYIFFIDCKSEKADQIEKVIISELKSGGWHRICTEHRHLSTDLIRIPVAIKTGSDSFDFIIEGKQFGSATVNIRPEHDNCVALRNELFNRYSLEVSLTEVYHKIFAVLMDMDIKEILF